MTLPSTGENVNFSDMLPFLGMPNGMISVFTLTHKINMKSTARQIALLLTLCATSVTAQENKFIANNDVIWQNLGTNENDSMPAGNGDLALNTWTEQSGDIVLLLAKSDAWSENGQLLKIGRVRVQLTPNPFKNSGPFIQTLKLEDGEIVFQSGENTARIWVDANRPVIHLEVETKDPVYLQARTELWRTNQYHLNQTAVQQAGFFECGNNSDGLDFLPDTVLPAQKNCIFWCHFNTNSIYPLVFQKENLSALLSKYPDPLLHRCFGIAMTGARLTADGNQTLKSSQTAKSFHLELHALTQQAASAQAWQSAIAHQVETNASVNLQAARLQHEKWWHAFWDRSWIHVGGTSDAEKISQGYAIQRYMTACAGRGAQPIKFNGSLFTVGHDLATGTSSTSDNHDPDFRAWGASFWNQNTRLIYWPLINSGDYDLLAPWFDMYVKALPLAKDRTQTYFHHNGALFIETIYFWGLPNVNDFGWNNSGTELQSEWMRYHVQGGLEIVAQMLDRYENTQDRDFARETLVPIADAVIAGYDAHWPRGQDGKIHLTPAQSIETYQVDAVNPTPDIAGLMDVLPRLLALPSAVVEPAQRKLWKKILNDLPPLPLGTIANGKLPPRGIGDAQGKRVILPAEKYGSPRNRENPELYTVFPYRLFGIGKRDLELAQNTFSARLYPFDFCWGQDGVQAALLGLTADAQRAVMREFTNYGNQRFRWFWIKSSDWIPDMDNGGAGMSTLQLMLMQCDGERIQLLPAWPDDWTADFKLHAPLNTTVEGHVEHGKLTSLKTTPASRVKDVVIVGSSKIN
jgi:hypothetical protein